MTDERSAAASDEPLQFDRVEPAGTPAGPSGGVACRACGRALPDEYYAAGSAPICANCKRSLEEGERAARTWPRFLRAASFGVGAAIAGAILYYAVIAITNLEIGLVAILIGYMVGWAVLKGAGRGSRRYQVLALILTYTSVGLAYLPIAFKEVAKSQTESRTTNGSSPAEAPAAPAPATATAVAQTEPAPAPAAAQTAQARQEGPSLPDFVFAAALLFGFSLALPVLVVVGSLPSGLISALIIGFGMRQAWRMTAAPGITISGPYKVGAAAAPLA